MTAVWRDGTKVSAAIEMEDEEGVFVCLHTVPSLLKQAMNIALRAAFIL